MTLTIHRGTHQIGGTCVELRLGETRVIPIHTRHPEKFNEYFGNNVIMIDDGQLIEI